MPVAATTAAAANAVPAPRALLLALGSALLLWASPARAYAELSDEALRHIHGAPGDLDARTGALLAPLLIPRAPGTPGSEAAKGHLARFFEGAKGRQEGAGSITTTTGDDVGVGGGPWDVEWHNFTARVPTTAGGHEDVRFGNLVMTRDPPWVEPGRKGDVGRLALVAHHDSLAHPEGFVGAVDSAAPCAILMQVARAVDGALSRKWTADEAAGGGGAAAGWGLEEDKGLQILFLDGEEAFVRWTDDDSIYGARALAAKWDGEAYAPASPRRGPLEAIDLFVLLDLLGAPGPRVPSYFEATHWAYQRLARVEARMRGLGLLRSAGGGGGGGGDGGATAAGGRQVAEEEDAAVFLPDSGKGADEFTPAYVLDDHVPFLQRGVPVLHVVPTPFPAVWHKIADDGAHLDPPAVDDWAKIMTAFVAEWMELGDYMLDPARGPGAAAEGKTEL